MAHTIRILPDGTIEVESDDLRAAAEVCRLIRQGEAASAPAERLIGGSAALQAGPAQVHATGTVESAEVRLLKVLNVLRNHRHGILNEKLAEAVGAKSSRSLSKLPTVLDRRLQGRGFTSNDVLSIGRTNEGSIWKPRQRIDDAIAVLTEGAQQ